MSRSTTAAANVAYQRGTVNSEDAPQLLTVQVARPSFGRSLYADGKARRTIDTYPSVIT
jgi:hypothetical protein